MRINIYKCFKIIFDGKEFIVNDYINNTGKFGISWSNKKCISKRQTAFKMFLEELHLLST